MAWVLAVASFPIMATAVSVEVAQAPPVAAATSQDCVGASSPPSASPAMTPYSNAASPFLLPAWGDGAGWSNPSMYQTIVSGDIDGDGYGDLVARNTAGIEAHTVAPPYRAPVAGADKTTPDAPWPGQWTTKPDANAPAFPETGVWGYSNGEQPLNPSGGNEGPYWFPQFSDPSRYTTFRLADVDGKPGDELIVRRPHFATVAGDRFSNQVLTDTGVDVYHYENGAWSNPISGPAWDDYGPIPAQGGMVGVNPQGWFLPQYYETITTGDIDGTVDASGHTRKEIIGRGPDGIESYSLNAVGSGFDRLDPTSGILTDAQGWNLSPAQYETIKTGDFFGDGTDEIIAWASDTAVGGAQGAGLLLYRYDPASHTWGWVDTIGSWTTANGWANPAQYRTIRVADINGDGRDDVVGRGPAGLEAWTVDPVSRTWTPMITTPSTLAGSPFDQAPYYETILAADVLGSAGTTTTSPPAEVLARWPDGVHTYSYDPNSRSFQDTGLVATQFSDANGWNLPDRYESIRAVKVREGAAGQPDLQRALVGRDATGLRTFVVPQVPRPTQWVTPTAPFPAWAGGPVPSASGDNSDAGRAYNYLNTKVGNELWPKSSYPGQPVPAPDMIRTKYTDLTQDMGIVASTTQQVVPQRLNVTRATWNSTKQQLTDWTVGVQRMRAAFFSSSGATSIEQLLLTSLVVGSSGYSVDTISQQFDPGNKSRMWATIGNLVWGVIGGLGDGFLISVLAAGVASAFAYIPTGTHQQQLQLAADELNLMIVNAFCQADQFLYGSHDQTVGDLGLLTAMNMNISAGGVSSSQYLRMQQELTRQRAIWIYQQFAQSEPANGGWTIGWSGPGEGVNKDMSKNYPDMPWFIGDYYYSPQAKGNCAVGAQAAYDTLTQQLGVDQFDLYTPVWTFWDGSTTRHPGEFVGRSSTDVNGNPITVTGMAGWGVRLEHCGS